jgi:hypothetical protein
MNATRPGAWLFGLEEGPRWLGLPDDRAERAGPKLLMIGHGYGDGGIPKPPLHDDVAPPLPHPLEALLGQDGAYVPA